MKRLVLTSLLLLAMVGGSACGSDDRQTDAEGAPSPVCRRLRAAFAESTGAGPGRMDQERLRSAVLTALRQPGPLSAPGRAAIPGYTGSGSQEDLEAVSRWFLAQCVGPTAVERPEDRRLLPRHPSTRLPLCLAMDTAELTSIGIFPRPEVPDGASAFWGDASRSDPWSGTVVSLTTLRGDRVPVHDDAVPTRVRDRPALVAPAPLFQAISSAAWGHVVSWQERPGLVAEVALRNGSPDDVVRMAERVRFEGDRPVLPADALGARTETLFDGVSSLQPLGLFGGEWSAVYGAGEGLFQVIGHRPAPAAVRVLQYWSVHSEPVTINGHSALLYAAFDPEDGPWGAIWEDDGLTVQVVGFAGRDEVLRFAGSLDDVSPAAWRAAKAEAQMCDDSP